MEYNFSAIGKRIKEQRKERGWSQDQLIDVLRDKFPIGRNTLSSIENGNAQHFELSLLTALCEVFDCDMGYILCEYEDCKTRDLQFVHDMTGLSETAILTLKDYNDLDGAHIIDLLDDLIRDRSDDGFNTLAQIASIAHALTALRPSAPANSLQANVNFAGLNWTCQNSFMQFIDRYTKV